MTSFEQFSLSPGIMEGVRKMGFTRPTPVQAAAIPEVLKGRDLMVQAKTGSGKTLAFGLPVLARLDPNVQQIQALVIVPTRELAIQVAEEIGRVGEQVGVLVSAIYGGTKMGDQMTDLAWSSVIVGTPGRLRDHLTRGNLHLDHCATVVLDEADEMLDMGFKDDLEFILAALPASRTTLLFSATFSKPIETIARKYMRQAEKIAVSSGLTTPTDIAHRVLRVDEARRIDALISLIQKESPTLGIVFCKRKSETASIARKLRSASLKAGFLNGDMNQAQRIATLDQFKRGELNILVATDVAARGLDISGISHVFNVSTPQDTETYVHRSGRTGRAGKKGICVTLVTPQEERYFAKIQSDLAESARKQAASAPPAQVAPALAIPAARPQPMSAEVTPEPHAPRRREPRPTAERQVPSRLAAGPRYSMEAVYRDANGQADEYREIARELMQQADPEEIISVLLAQTAIGKRWRQKPQSRDKSNNEQSNRHARTNPWGGRMNRKPSQVVYAD